MRRSLRLVLGVGLVLGAGTRAPADVWDVQTDNDNTTATENELLHGSDQLHDLGALAGPATDQDWFRLSQKSFSSYEVVTDATSGDIGATLNLQRIAPDGTTVMQSSVGVGLGYSRSLRWSNATAVAVDDQYIRVTSGSCTTDCGADDVYRIRFYETTQAVPRFNNAGSQVTVLLLQNPTSYSIAGNVYFWDTAGALIAPSAFTLGPRQLLVLNTATVAPGVGGAMTLAHDGRFGDLAGKTVALEPATGFSFDSPMVLRVH
jgi:hypothetical protein